MTPEEIPNVPEGQQATYTFEYNCFCCDATQFTQLPINIIPKTPPGTPPITPPDFSPGCPQCSPSPSSSESMSVMQKPPALVQKQKSMEADQTWRPVYNYIPIILNEYTEVDYAKHVEIYANALEQDKISARNAKISADACQAYYAKSGRQLNRSMIQVSALKTQMPIRLRQQWYLVVDTKVLLEDMYFIEKLVKSDNDCKLFLPFEILNDLTAMIQEMRPAFIKIPAKRLAKFYCRLIQCGKEQGVKACENILLSPVALDSVINCCMQLMKEYFYVVLITDDSGRRERANSIGLTCYTLNEARVLSAKEKLTVTFINNYSVYGLGGIPFYSG